jgi:hypothetical protein
MPSDNANPNADKGQQTAAAAKAEADARKAAKDDPAVDNALPEGEPHPGQDLPPEAARPGQDLPPEAAHK